MAKSAQKLVANNKKAYHDYFVEETWEAGLALAGTEVKSLRLGKCSIKEAFIKEYFTQSVRLWHAYFPL